jgi:hypothetical protein
VNYNAEFCKPALVCWRTLDRNSRKCADHFAPKSFANDLADRRGKLVEVFEGEHHRNGGSQNCLPASLLPPRLAQSRTLCGQTVTDEIAIVYEMATP